MVTWKNLVPNELWWLIMNLHNEGLTGSPEGLLLLCVALGGFFLSENKCNCSKQLEMCVSRTCPFHLFLTQRGHPGAHSAHCTAHSTWAGMSCASSNMKTREEWKSLLWTLYLLVVQSFTQGWCWYWTTDSWDKVWGLSLSGTQAEQRSLCILPYLWSQSLWTGSYWVPSSFIPPWQDTCYMHLLDQHQNEQLCANAFHIFWTPNEIRWRIQGKLAVFSYLLGW